jgi:outer membrane protein assembly factor BamA
LYSIICICGWCFSLKAQNSPDSSISVVPSADSTRQFVIGNILIEGNRRTKEYIIRRELGIHVGDTLSSYRLSDELEIDRRKLLNTNLFVTVDMLTVLQEDSAHVQVKVVVKERFYVMPIPVFQLADRNFNEWWYDRNRDIRRTTYGMYFSYANVTGRADRLRILTEFGFLPKYEISYTLPYIDKKMRLGVSAGVSYATNKSMAFRTWNDKLDFLQSEDINRRRFHVFGSISYRKRFYATHLLDVRHMRATLSDTILQLNPQYVMPTDSSQKYFQITYTYSYDKRDIAQYPLRGTRYGVQISKRGVFSSDDIDQCYIYGWYHKYIPLADRWFVNTAVRGRITLAKNFGYMYNPGLGYGQDYVRGYELYVVDGKDYVVWKNEAKFKLFEVRKFFSWVPIRQFNTLPLAAYLTTFADAGYANNQYPERSNTRLGNKWIAGAGMGLDVVTFYNLVGRLNYTFNGLGEKRFFFSVSREF